MNTHDSITVIRTYGNLKLAKTIKADGTIIPYGKARFFDLFPRPIADSETLHRLLIPLQRRYDCAVGRGVPISLDRCRHVRRLTHRDAKTGYEPTLREQAHTWLAIDIENLERPGHIDVSDLVACAHEAIQHLPAAFHGARCIIQASSQHGIKPDIRLRLWFWLKRPTTGAELKVWLGHLKPVVDPCIFEAHQPIYTSSPIFENGARDRLLTRIATIDGAATVAVPGLIVPPPKVVSARVDGAASMLLAMPMSVVTAPQYLPAGLADFDEIDRSNVKALIREFIHDSGAERLIVVGRIEATVTRVAAAIPHVNRHRTLNRESFLCGGLIAGFNAKLADFDADNRRRLAIAIEPIINRLLAALRSDGIDFNLAHHTAHDGIARGALDPIDVFDDRANDIRYTARNLIGIGITDQRYRDALRLQNGRSFNPLPDEAVDEIGRRALAEDMANGAE